jgi:hypothetical protein
MARTFVMKKGGRFVEINASPTSREAGATIQSTTSSLSSFGRFGANLLD